MVQAALSTPERWLRGVLIGHAILSALLAVAYLVDGDTRTVVGLPNSFAKDALFVALSVVAAADVRRFGGLALVIAAGYVALIVGEIAALIWGGAPPMDLPLIGEVSATAALLAWMGIDAVLAVLFTWLWFAGARAQHGLRYLNPLAFHTLAAVAEVLVEGEREAIAPRQVARNVDGYLADLESAGKNRVQVALTVLGLWPLLTARPPLATLDPATRKRFLQKRFVDEIVERRVFQPLRPVVQALIRTGSQMSYLGYYGDRDSWDSIGYTVYPHRPGGRPPLPDDAIEPPLTPLTEPPHRRYDTVVIGSGAAGGILAYRFAEAGRKVLVLERGPYVDPRRFNDDEVAQYLRLYNEGALQLATDFGLQVLQGMCVGGGTTINNALCLPPPEQVLEHWEPRGLDRAALERRSRRCATGSGWRRSARRPPPMAAKRFQQAVEELDLPGVFEVMEANISAACRATGYCNIGCGYGAKLSTLDTVLPRAQQRLRARPARRRARGPDRARGQARGAGGRPPRTDGPTRGGRGRRDRDRCRGDRLELPAPAQRPRRRRRRPRPALQHQLADHGRLPRARRLVRRHPDVARLPVVGRRPALPGGDLVQPARHAGAGHAGLVRPPLRQHAALPAHGVRGRAGRHDGARPREGVEARARDRVHGVRRGPRDGRRGPPGGRADLAAGRRRARHARDLRVAGVPRPGRAGRAARSGSCSPATCCSRAPTRRAATRSARSSTRSSACAASRTSTCATPACSPRACT